MSLSAVRHADGRLKLLVCQVRDITESRAQQVRLGEITRRFEGAFEYAPIGMSLVDLNGHWLRVNRELCQITGYTESELLSKSFRDITHPDDHEQISDVWDSLLQRDHMDSEKRYLHADGHVIWVAVCSNIVRDENDEPQYIVTQTRDITERVRLERSLAHLADHDPLTELFNRRRFESELGRQVRLSRRYGDCAALLMLDLDHFKYVNDSLGHTVGDRVIGHVAKLLAGRLRDVDILARLGGDEFAVLLPRVDARHATVIATELVDRIEKHPFTHDAHHYRLSCSAGVVMLDWSTASAEDALVSADIALYDAKQRGRNRVAVFSPVTREDVLEGLTWSQRLRDALQSDDFELHAQPIVDLSTGETVMRELLIRMRSETGQIIPPARFLEPAARFGYMPEIDRWVIGKAAQLAALEPGRPLAVNLAAQTIIEPDLVDDVTAQLALAGARPQDIIFELSEAAVIANLDQAREACEQLRALGCRIALDDFGSGFSGFPYLKALTVDLLKIDGQFIRDLANNRIDRLVVRAILDVAEGMGLPTVAEFVVDEAVAVQCRALGATYGQGFHLGRPEPIELPAPPQDAGVRPHLLGVPLAGS